jgi:hypothetical protein
MPENGGYWASPENAEPLPPEAKVWVIWERNDGTERHIVPTNDTMTHTDGFCDCDPEISMNRTGDVMIYGHRAKDGRA